MAMLNFGAILLWVRMWFVHEFPDADPSAVPQVPWMLQRRRLAMDDDDRWGDLW